MAVTRTALPTTLTGDAAQDERHLQMVEALRIPLNCPILRGASISVTAAPGADVTIAHGLGRQPAGWLITDAATSPPQLHRVSWDTRTLVLHHSGGSESKFNLWVY